jgi:hypothetical protein
MRHRWRKTAKEVDPPSLIFIDFGILTFTSGLHWAETALEFSNNKTLPVICRIQRSVACKEGYMNTMCLTGTIYVNIEKIRWQRAEICGTSACISLVVDISLSAETLNFRCERKKPKSLSMLVESIKFDNLYIKPEGHVLSKAFSMSKNTAAVDILQVLLKLRVAWSVILIHCSVVRWRPRKTNWLPLSKPHSLMYF